MTLLRRAAIVLALVGFVGAAPAFAQPAGTVGEFNYSPEAQQRAQSIVISGRCVSGGSTENVDMIVTVQQGADGTGDYGFSKRFLPSQSGAISGTIEVPVDAPFGDYVIGGACRNGPTVFFSKNGPFAVVERGGGTTSTTAARPTTTAAAPETTTTAVPDPEATTTTAPDEPTTTTTQVEITFGDPDDTTSTTVDEFAGTRNEDDDDSIGSLLLLIGIVPLVLAIVAVLVAMRRRGPTPPAPGI